ncbi:hypothetical protein [Chryseobacterium pennae]|uniref:hypothetical protein n=1 Tax=Chryseobacterium pennae TaxID=2258962 RepID=UPI001401D6CC|nr:hypothetical protein [Chryseobacterium pennae]
MFFLAGRCVMAGAVSIIGRKENLLCDQKEELFYLRRSSVSIIGAVADMEAPGL